MATASKKTTAAKTTSEKKVETTEKKTSVKKTIPKSKTTTVSKEKVEKKVPVTKAVSKEPIVEKVPEKKEIKIKFQFLPRTVILISEKPSLKKININFTEKASKEEIKEIKLNISNLVKEFNEKTNESENVLGFIVANDSYFSFLVSSEKIRNISDFEFSKSVSNVENKIADIRKEKEVVEKLKSNPQSFVLESVNSFSEKGKRNFFKNLAQNPNANSRRMLFKFVVKNKLSITDEGFVIGLKKVNYSKNTVVQNFSKYLFEQNSFLKKNLLSKEEYDSIEVGRFAEKNSKKVDEYAKQLSDFIKRSNFLKEKEKKKYVTFDKKNESFVFSNSKKDLDYKELLSIADSDKFHYTDVHSGTTLISIGKITRMKRVDCDDNEEQDCSSGLHIGSYKYVKSFGGNRTLVCLFNPRDAVSVPSYDSTKIRVSAYMPILALTNDEFEKYNTKEDFNLVNIISEELKDKFYKMTLLEDIFSSFDNNWFLENYEYEDKEVQDLLKNVSLLEEAASRFNIDLLSIDKVEKELSEFEKSLFEKLKSLKLRIEGISYSTKTDIDSTLISVTKKLKNKSLISFIENSNLDKEDHVLKTYNNEFFSIKSSDFSKDDIGDNYYLGKVKDILSLVS